MDERHLSRDMGSDASAIWEFELCARLTSQDVSPIHGVAELFGFNRRAKTGARG